MSFGVFITEGLQNWQILQQINGVANFKISGSWVPSPEMLEDRKALLFGRIVSENTGETIIDWKPASWMDNQLWRIEFSDVPCGGLYRVETCLLENDLSMSRIRLARRGDMRFHIGVGDVFVIAGQSNAAGYGREPIEDCPEPGVHILRNSGTWDLAAHPLNESTNTVHEANMENTNPGVSPFLAFAKVLKQHLNYPIGLIQTAKGGSLMDRWTPSENGDLYDLLLDVVTKQGGNIQGILWYHGCSDALSREESKYAERFRNLVMTLRAQLNHTDLPFFTVQLNRHLDIKEVGDDDSWGAIREIQRQMPAQIPGVYVVPAEDLPLSDGLHNSSSGNVTLGRRMARQCLNVLYLFQELFQAPDVKSVDLNGKRLSVHFADVQGNWILITNKKDTRLFFTVRDEHGNVPVDSIEVLDTTIVLTLERGISSNCYLSGGFEANPTYNLPIDSVTQLPALAFYKIPVIEERIDSAWCERITIL